MIASENKVDSFLNHVAIEGGLPLLMQLLWHASSVFNTFDQWRHSGVAHPESSVSLQAPVVA